jgi:hypothetical protein
MELTKEQIKSINEASPMDWQTNEQGVFTEPNGIPNKVKEPVIYMRWEIGGISGGSCWDSSNPQPYTIGTQPSFEVLDLVLKELCPNISYLMFRGIEKLINDSETHEWEYYGNCTNFSIKYIVLSELITYLEEQTYICISTKSDVSKTS